MCYFIRQKSWPLIAEVLRSQYVTFYIVIDLVTISHIPTYANYEKYAHLTPLYL